MKNFELIKKIISDELAGSVSAVMALNFFEDTMPLAEYNNEEFDGDYSFSENGIVFAEDGGCGFYILLDDGSIGYANPSYDECGRTAENMQEFLEMMLNTSSWQNYMDEHFVDQPLDKSEIEACEAKGREDYADAYGNEFPPYEEAAKKISEHFGLRLSEDITQDVLPKLYKAMTRKPQFTVTIDGGTPLHLVGKD
ncbi:MAG: SMI1/KNR4 family protein [Butyrivibrio sp.]|nr:SMI1/KNR4 family protein [Butyrivibrio sp.]